MLETYYRVSPNLWVENPRSNVLALAITLGLGIQLLGRIVACEVLTELHEFFRADALSARMVLLIAMFFNSGTVIRSALASADSRIYAP